MIIFNSYGRKKEQFIPIKKNRVGIYSCGQTVYDYTHIGNLRTYIFEDILRRVLPLNGYQVTHVQNITDVGHLTSDADSGEDKIVQAARREHKSAWEITKYYTKTFKDDLKKVNVLAPHIWCKATDHIKEQIELIQVLEKKGFTYQTNDGVYFDTTRLKDYGKLAGLSQQSIKAGARIAIKDKKHPTDFALWKFSYPEGRSFDSTEDEKTRRRQMEWPSPWGLGFPGWHIECSAMSRKYLGMQFDIHCGGVDHIGVHHTNEIAQSQAANGKIPARYWLHGEHLLVNGAKMSKSKNNFYTLRNLEKKGYNPLAFRYLVLMTHYRDPLNFTWEALQAAQKGLARIYGFLYNMFLESRDGHDQDNPTFQAYLKEKLAEFQQSLNDDLNTPQALAIMFEVMHDSNELFWQGKLSNGDLKKLEQLFLQFDQVFGLKFVQYLEKGKKAEVPTRIKKLVTKRVGLRKKGDFSAADKIRQEIVKLGYQVEDTDTGPVIKKTKIL